MTPEEQKRQQEEFEDILFKSKRKFSDRSTLFFAEGYFALRIYSGTEYETFVLTPQQAKKLGAIFMSQVANYEKVFGEITFPPAPPILSPIQLDNPGSSDSSKDSNLK